MIIWIILILVALICFLPLRCQISVSTHGSEIKVKYLFFSFTLLPTSNKEGKQNSDKGKDKNKKKDKNNAKEQIKFFVSSKDKLLPTIGQFVKYITRHGITIEKFIINAKIGAGDPADTGIICGGLYSLVYQAIAVVHSVTKIKEHKVDISPEFDDAILEAKLYILIRTRLAHTFVLLVILAKLLAKHKSAKKIYERSFSKENEK